MTTNDLIQSQIDSDSDNSNDNDSTNQWKVFTISEHYKATLLFDNEGVLQRWALVIHL